jgi:hypothetical protein
MKGIVFWVVTLYGMENNYFWRNVLPPFSGSKSEPSKKPRCFKCGITTENAVLFQLITAAEGR